MDRGGRSTSGRVVLNATQHPLAVDVQKKKYTATHSFDDPDRQKKRFRRCLTRETWCSLNSGASQRVSGAGFDALITRFAGPLTRIELKTLK